MNVPTPESEALRKLIGVRRAELRAVLEKYGATNPRLFGSVARGDAGAESDIDILVDLDPAGGNVLFRVGGLSEEFREILGHKVDIFSPELLREPVSQAALSDAVSL